jgi:hypothetical protein
MAWVGGGAVLGPVVAKRALGGAGGWGIVVAAEALGLVAAGMLALRWRPERLLLWGVLGLFLGAPYLASLAVPLSLPFVVLAVFATGFGLELFNVYWVTALQQHIADEVLARVNSYDALGSFVFIPVGLTVVGPIADGIGVSTTLWIVTAIDALMAIAMLASADVRRLRRVEALVVPGPDAEPVPPPIR